MENLENPSSDTSLVLSEISEINLEATSRNCDEDNNNSFFTCEICVELAPLNSKFNNLETICSHNYCIDCIAKYIQVKVSQDNMSHIKCPNANCSLSEKVFEKWCLVHCESAVLLESSKGGFAYGRSYCPYRDCSELILNECVGTNGSNKVTKSNCPNCKKLFCCHCMVPWKENHECIDRNETIIDIDSNDVLFIENVKRNKWVRCPSCYHYVEHNKGCSLITCRCKTRFCYNC
ncbi:E3 ubiquitin-protein ligase RNF144B-like [Papaver somniferum]|uniref:E3 ubiquitin-protein ligase RNF144B-like n=1 Tax=Papaver somniferum TaxID=3469 RepID=UPI000E6FDDCA|nr:E3 ubiquitin-protein ligase RNF144B-like [Papaver somniferum]